MNAELKLIIQNQMITNNLLKCLVLSGASNKDAKLDRKIAIFLQQCGDDMVASKAEMEALI